MDLDSNTVRELEFKHCYISHHFVLNSSSFTNKPSLLKKAGLTNTINDNINCVVGNIKP